MIPDLVCALPLLPSMLPPGIHATTLREVEATFAINDHRKWLFDGVLKAVSHLHAAGCRRIYLGGSYVTSKPHPGDYDGCWDPTGVNRATVDPIFISMPAGKAMQKLKYRGELWQGRHDLRGFDAWPNFFQQDDRLAIVKGILEIKLS